jgi:hypothetical protein
VVAEQVERRLLVLADHDGGELVDLWEHDCVNPGSLRSAPRLRPPDRAGARRKERAIRLRPVALAAKVCSVCLASRLGLSGSSS